MEQLEQLYQEVTNILKNHPFNISKNLKISHRLYQNKCIAIDISDGYLRFALDVGFENDEASSIYVRHFVRNTNTERVIRKTEQYRAIQSNTEQYRAIQNNAGKYRSLIIQAINDWLAVYQELFAIKVSVIIPTYNRAHVLPRLLKSINEQTADKDSFEVIFVDDCSSDNTIEVIQSTLNSDIHYQVHKLPVNSGGASIPRNLGIKLARGEYIIFVDSDDNIYSYTIKDVMDFVDKTGCDVCYFQVSSLSGRIKKTQKVFLKGSIEDADFLRDGVNRTLAAYRCFRASLIKVYDISFPMIKTGEDRIFTLSCLIDARKVSILAGKDYYDLEAFDELSLCAGNNGDKNYINGSFSKHESRMVTHFTWWDIVSRSSKNYIERLKMFNGTMHHVFNELITGKQIDNPDIIRTYLTRISSLGFVIIKDEIRDASHREAYEKMKLYDVYNVCQ